MLKSVAAILFLLFFTVQLTGCAAGRRQNDLQMQAMRNQVSVLESQLQSRDQEISNLREVLLRAEQQQFTTADKTGKRKLIGEVKTRPNARQIQTALANAGFDPGGIDGKLGKQTRDAVRAFQRANDLEADGKVGKRTWALLKEYLYKKTK